MDRRVGATGRLTRQTATDRSGSKIDLYPGFLEQIAQPGDFLPLPDHLAR
jgi:hypothetical protein